MADSLFPQCLVAGCTFGATSIEPDGNRWCDDHWTREEHRRLTAKLAHAESIAAARLRALERLHVHFGSRPCPGATCTYLGREAMLDDCGRGLLEELERLRTVAALAAPGEPRKGQKQAAVIYVAPIPTERSGIGTDVPAHVKLEWRDEQGRRCHAHLGLSDKDIERVAALPDTRKEGGE